MTRNFADILMDSYVGGLPIAAMASDRNARARERYYQQVTAYASAAIVNGRGSGTKPDLEVFGSFEDSQGYRGRNISSGRLSWLYKVLHAGRRDLIDRSLQAVNPTNCALSFDDTFKVVKRLSEDGGSLNSCFKSLMTSRGQIAYHQICETKSALAAEK